MKQLVIDVEQRLTDARMPAGYPRPRKNDRLFEYVSVDWGQADFYADSLPMKFPAALISILSANYTDEGRKGQIGIVDLQVRIIDVPLSNISGRAPAEQRAKAFAMFDLMRETNRLLHGWTGSGLPHLVEPPAGGYGQLTKVNFTNVNRQDRLTDYRLLYRVQVSDYSAVPEIPTKPATPKVRVERVEY